jgi:hypothetical protein
MVMGVELRTAIDEATVHAPWTTRSQVRERFFPDVSWENFDKALTNLAMDGQVTSWPYKGDRLVALTEQGRELKAPPHRQRS